MSISKNTNYRDNGAIGALLDEYERALDDLVSLINGIPNQYLPIIADTVTKDKDCVSIQSILTHVLRAGYGYATYIRNHQGESVAFVSPSHLDASEMYIEALKQMFLFTEKVFNDYPHIILDESDEAKKIHVSWGQQFDVDQLMEHAIVHILRHRRQIERFLLKDIFQK